MRGLIPPSPGRNRVKVKTRQHSSSGSSSLILKKFSGNCSREWFRNLACFLGDRSLFYRSPPCISSKLCYLHLLLLALLVSGFGNLKLEEKNFVTIVVEKTQHPGCEWSRRREMGIGIWTTKRGRKQSIQEICSRCPDPASCLPATGRPWRIWARPGPSL